MRNVSINNIRIVSIIHKKQNMITLDTLKERPLSYSSIKEFAKSPKHYISYLNRKRESTPALQFGSMIHCILLEPSEFQNRYAISPKFDMRKSADKELFAKFQSENEGKEVVSESVYNEVYEITEIVKDNPEWTLATHGAKFEVKDYTEIYDLPFIRIKDIVKDSGTIDVKTVQNGQIDAIIKDFFNYQYYIQAAIYGAEFSFYVVEKSAPFWNGLIPVDKRFMDFGKAELERLCVGFNYCLSNPECFKMGYEFWYMMNRIKPIVKLPNWVRDES